MTQEAERIRANKVPMPEDGISPVSFCGGVIDGEIVNPADLWIMLGDGYPGFIFSMFLFFVLFVTWGLMDMFSVLFQNVLLEADNI